MLNQVVIVGRLVSDPKNETLENGKNVTAVTLAIPRSYKNNEGIYDTDFIPIILYAGIASQACEYCLKGDLVGVKGRIETRTTEENRLIVEVIADKLTFLSSGNKPRKEEESGE